MKPLLQQINSTLDALLPEDFSLSPLAQYSLDGGKRLRPLAVLTIVDALGGDRQKALVPAASVELVHAYSLIHDDLPCMDDDAIRRGKPSLHTAFPEWKALLTGDYLLTLAFDALASAPDLSDRDRIALIRMLAKGAGSKGMIGGQVLDLEGNGEYETLNEQKTGALFGVAFGFGAILGGADISSFMQIGTRLGIAFQLVDDLKDGDGAAAVMETQKMHAMVQEIVDNAKTGLCNYPLLVEFAEMMVHLKKKGMPPKVCP